MSQEPLFDVAPVKRKRKGPFDDIKPIAWPDGIRPWDPINEQDTQLGWEHTFVTPRRAVAIRLEVEAGRRA
jgi:hypothetical protein